jgi:purine nucleosidase/pyrimidine-specific ribonucleoside hydrolase
MRHVLIDTDPGVDDALALILALRSPELKVEAITTVSGNLDIKTVSRNSLKLLEFLGVDNVPVAMGATKPLCREPRRASDFHGIAGLGDAILPEPKLKQDSRTAFEVIRETAESYGEELTIVALGPLTNIAVNIMENPDVIENVSGLTIMGGAYGLTPYGIGNVNAVAEYNIWHDPEAAKVVFQSGIPIKAFGLDVTSDPKNRLSRDMFADVCNLRGRNAELVSKLCGRIVERNDGMSLHDPLTIAAVIEPGIAKLEKHLVKIETMGKYTLGMTVVDRRPNRCDEEPNVDVCTSVDGKMFHDVFMNRVVGRPEGKG